MIVTENLTPSFLKNPNKFLKRFLIRIPISEHNFRTAPYGDYVLGRISTVTAYDLATRSNRSIEVADLLIAKDSAVDLAGGAVAHIGCMRAHYSPFIERKITSITLDRSAKYFFSAELSGCTLAFSNHHVMEVLHIPPAELSTFKKNQPAGYRLIEPGRDYDDGHNKRTVIVGIRRHFRNTWRFYKQTYVDARLSTLPNRSFSENGYKFLRLSCFEEF